MSSLTRRIQRRLPRQLAAAERRSALRKGEDVAITSGRQPTRLLKDGSIEVLRPTKGWLRTSAARVALRIEQARHMAVMLAAVS